MIAALFVQRGGCYWGLDGVDAWDEARDARLYAGPHPVVAHPPCERWGRYASGGPSNMGRFIPGDDGRCFESALRSVHAFGGVLEHPAQSKAWSHYLLPKPPPWGGWVRGMHGGWACQVDQGKYGHRAAKATWLYAVTSAELPDMRWGPSGNGIEPNERERRLGRRSGVIERMSKRQRAATPTEFRDLLLSIARSVNEVAP